MYASNGVFRLWRPNRTMFGLFLGVIMSSVSVTGYTIVIMFVFRYCQAIGNKYGNLLSSRKGMVYQVAFMIVICLALEFPNNMMTDEQMAEYVDYLKTNESELYDFVKDGSLYGIRVRFLSS